MEPDLPKTSSSGKRIGRPRHEPTPADRAKVERMHGMGIPQYQIATIFSISVKTLRRRYRKELSQSAVTANLKVIETLYKMATSGDNAAASIFWARTRCGFACSPAALSASGEPNATAAQGKAAPPAKVSLYRSEPPAGDSVRIFGSKGDRIA
jgi:hypothetical protein